MAGITTIQCEDCGRPRQTRKVNTKYCIPCRLLRNVKFIGKATSKCIVCEKPFAPLQRGEEVCGECDNIPVSGDPRGTCAFCGTNDARLLDSDVSVCRPCGTNPEKRTLLKAALHKKQAAAQKENLR